MLRKFKMTLCMKKINPKENPKKNILVGAEQHTGKEGPGGGGEGRSAETWAMGGGVVRDCFLLRKSRHIRFITIRFIRMWRTGGKWIKKCEGGAQHTADGFHVMGCTRNETKK